MTTTTTGTERRPHPTPGNANGGKPTALHAVREALATHPGATTAELAHAAGTAHSTTGKALATLQNTGTARRQEGARDHNNRRTPDRWYPTHPTTTTNAAASPKTDTETTTVSENTPNTPDNAAQPQATDTDNAPAPTATPDTNKKTTTETEPTEPTQNAEEPDTPASDAPPPTSTHTPPQANTSQGTTRLRPGALRDLVITHLTAHPHQAFTATGISRVIGKSSGAIANALITLTKQGLAHQVTNHPRRYQLTPTDDRQQ